MSKIIIRSAIELVTERGFAVFPLQAGSKVPLPGSHAVHDATKDIAAIEKWDPTWELAIACGAISEILVVDIDPRNGGDESWRQFVEAYGEVETLTAMTWRGDGGQHRYFRYPGPRDYVKKPLPGIDVLRDGFYVVAPPSRIGQGYRWVDPSVPIADLPEPLLNLIVRKPYKAKPRKTTNDASLESRVRRATAYLRKIPGAISGQDGHTATFKAACHLIRGFELPEHTAFELLATEFNPRCDPPWSEHELRHKVEEAAHRSTLGTGYLLERAS